MKLELYPNQPRQAIITLERGDIVHADGYMSATLFDDADEDFALIALFSPGSGINDVEIRIPESLITRLRAAIGQAVERAAL